MALLTLLRHASQPEEASRPGAEGQRWDAALVLSGCRRSLIFTRGASFLRRVSVSCLRVYVCGRLRLLKCRGRTPFFICSADLSVTSLSLQVAAAPAAAAIMQNALISHSQAAAARRIVRARHRLVREARLAFLHVLPAAELCLLPGTQSAHICFRGGVKTQTWLADIRDDEDA